MSVYKRVTIPHIITEFKEDMLAPLGRNFSEIERHVAQTQMRVEGLEAAIEGISEQLTGIEQSIEEIQEELNGEETTE